VAAELAKERELLNRATTSKPTRISRSEFPREYKSAVGRRLKVFTNREKVALSREALRNVLVDGRLVLQPDVSAVRPVSCSVLRRFALANHLDALFSRLLVERLDGASANRKKSLPDPGSSDARPK
jgi:hypothetical protein